MKARELRLGNLITSDGDVFVVNRIDEEFVHAGALFISKLGLDTEDYAIPLTEEWLTKFGFEPGRVTTKEWSEDGLEIKLTNQESYAKREIVLVRHKYPHWWTTIIDPSLTKYVHQIQNLYFSLTGEELVEQQGENKIHAQK